MAAWDQEKLRLYHVWRQMHVRCYDPTNKQYKDYGGRGIVVCEEWDSFERFLADMGPRPPRSCIDRTDNDGAYTPANCRWVDRATSSGNRRNCIYIEHNGDILSLKAYMRAIGRVMDYRMVTKRLTKGMHIKDALTVKRGTRFAT